MSWSIPIARLFGIPVYLHATFFLLLAFIVFQGYSRTQSWRVALLEMVFVMLVFGIIVLHELGHALAGRMFGVKTRDITLLPIGGVARLERIPENPYQEFVIAVAGPAVNVVLAAMCLVYMIASGEFLTSAELNPLATSSLIPRLLSVNVLLVLFNMIPAFPMDGGRVLRSVLAMGMDHLRATQIAARIGQMIAVGFGMFGLFTGQFMLLLIALFVWVGAASEAQAVETRSYLAGIRVRQAMISRFRTVAPGDVIDMVASYVLEGFQQDFPVVDGEQVVGIITRADMLKALAGGGRQAHVADVMQRTFVTAQADEPLNTALERLQTCDCHSMPVLEDGQLIGVLTSENVGEFLMIRAAARQATQGSK